ncbi:MAG: DUF805 domain-containing protein [Candidatus Nanopelagicales bacterium]
MSTPTPAPGWYPDPGQAGQERYWDGAAWTQSTQPVPGAVAPPPPPPAPPVAPAAPAAAVAGAHSYAPQAPAYSGPMYGGAPQVTFVEAIKLGFKKYARFEGRATRAEYWWWYLFTALVVGVFYVLLFIVIGIAAGTSSTSVSADGTSSTQLSGGSGALFAVVGLVFAVVVLALFIPTISVLVRRLHDTDKSGWWYWIGLVPFGGIVLLVFMVLESTPGPNRFGPPSRGAADLD